MRPRERQLRKALGLSVPETNEAAQHVARAVALAVAQTPADSPLPPELHGPIEIASTMAWPAIARRVGLPIDDEETRDALISYMIVGWTAMAMEFDVEHFRAWRADWEAAQRLPDLARAREAEIAHMAATAD